MTPPNLIQVVILEDHQSIIDGYFYRLGFFPDIQIVGTATFVEELDKILDQKNPDVLILDVFVPISPENSNFYPILKDIPRWLQKFSQLSILVISMHHSRSLVRAVMQAGASGYILKDDSALIQDLGNVIRSIARGDVRLSKRLYEYILTTSPENTLLTPRQLQALSLCAAYPDASTGELAEKLSVEHSTFRNLLSSAYLRLDVRNRAAAVAKARQLGLIPPQDPSASS